MGAGPPGDRGGRQRGIRRRRRTFTAKASEVVRAKAKQVLNGEVLNRRPQVGLREETKVSSKIGCLSKKLGRAMAGPKISGSLRSTGDGRRDGGGGAARRRGRGEDGRTEGGRGEGLGEWSEWPRAALIGIIKPKLLPSNPGERRERERSSTSVWGAGCVCSAPLVQFG